MLSARPALFACALSLAVSPARAQPAAPLSWSAPAGCPTAEVVQRRIERILNRPLAEASASLAVTAVVTSPSEAQPWSVTLESGSDAARASRTLQAASCGELANVTALFVAILLEPKLGEAAEPAAAPPGESGELFSPSAALPVGKWIGMKYVAYNLPGDQAVKLEAYIDADSNGDGTQPGHWKKVGETTDDGNWNAPVGSCGYPKHRGHRGRGGGVHAQHRRGQGRIHQAQLARDRALAPAKAAVIAGSFRRARRRVTTRA